MHAGSHALPACRGRRQVRTVQGELERAAGRLLLPAGRVVGASRTDGGAHARGQVAHLDVAGDAASIAPASLLMYLNGLLPGDVKVQQLAVAPPGARACVRAWGWPAKALQRLAGLAHGPAWACHSRATRDAAMCLRVCRL